MTLLAEAKVQGSHTEWPGRVPETDGRLKQNLAYHLPASRYTNAAREGGISVQLPLSGGRAVTRLITRLVVGSFLVEIALAEAWLRFAQGSSLTSLLWNGDNLGIALAAGFALAVLVAAASRYYFRRFAAEILRDFFEPLFRTLGFREVALLSVLPGIGEELLFRGVIQTAAGIVPATIVFGLLHSGFSRRLLSYGLWTTAVGGLLGVLYLWSGNLWGSIVSHALINASGTLWMKGKDRSSSSEAPGP